MNAPLEIIIKRDNDEYAVAHHFRATETISKAGAIRSALQWLEKNTPDEFWEAIEDYR